MTAANEPDAVASSTVLNNGITSSSTQVESTLEGESELKRHPGDPLKKTVVIGRVLEVDRWVPPNFLQLGKLIELIKIFSYHYQPPTPYNRRTIAVSSLA